MEKSKKEDVEMKIEDSKKEEKKVEEEPKDPFFGIHSLFLILNRLQKIYGTP
jgi:hypothetical protein